MYALTAENRELLKSAVAETFESGAEVVSYVKFYETHTSLLNGLNITSSEQLNAALRYYLRYLVFESSYFSPENTSKSIEDEVAGAYQDGEVVLSLDELARRLPYLEEAQIQNRCAHSDLFISADKGEYALYKRINIASQDVRETIEYFDAEINERGFSKVTKAIVEASVELNMDVPIKALQEALFKRYLAGRYNRKRDFITEFGYEINLNEAYRDFCDANELLTLDELENYEMELTEGARATTILSIAWERMARIDQERFLNLERFELDEDVVDAVDDALALFVQNRVAPFSSITSFSSFPHVEFEGAELGLDNLFLLESFCRFLSKRFRSLGRFAKKGRPVGAIYDAELKFDDYDELLTYVVANNAELPLVEKSVAEWLGAQGYIARKTPLDELINTARRMREQKESE